MLEATTSINAGPYMKSLLYLPGRKLKVIDKEEIKKKALKDRYNSLGENFQPPPKSSLVYGKNPKNCDVLEPPDINCTRAKINGYKIYKKQTNKTEEIIGRSKLKLVEYPYKQEISHE